jgi:hypothetical protein
MKHGLIRIAALGVLVIAGSVGLWMYQGRYGDARRIQDLSREVERLEEHKQQLEQIVQRLSAERRVADVLVVRQEMVDGVLQTELLFQEYARDGSLLPARYFTIQGSIAHIDAMVVKFERGFIEEGDALRGHNIVLFHKLYGDYQTPDEAHRIDEPGRIPEIYRGVDAKISRFEQALWTNFWKLVEHEDYREQYGVRLAQGEGVWLRFHPDRLYTLTVESDGGLNIRSEPLQGVYREALRRQQAVP